MNDKNLIKEALNKNKECCYMLAEKYYYGKGVPADRRLAKEWYEASAKMGHVSAQYMYGYILCASARGEEDLKAGIKYVKKAAGRLHTEAMLLLARNYFYGVGVDKNVKKAVKIWKKASEIGCPEAKYYLGLCYDKGATVKRNVMKAKGIFLRLWKTVTTRRRLYFFVRVTPPSRNSIDISDKIID